MESASEMDQRTQRIFPCSRCYAIELSATAFTNVWCGCTVRANCHCGRIALRPSHAACDGRRGCQGRSRTSPSRWLDSELRREQPTPELAFWSNERGARHRRCSRNGALRTRLQCHCAHDVTAFLDPDTFGKVPVGMANDGQREQVRQDDTATTRCQQQSRVDGSTQTHTHCVTMQIAAHDVNAWRSSFEARKDRSVMSHVSTSMNRGCEPTYLGLHELRETESSTFQLVSVAISV